MKDMTCSKSLHIAQDAWSSICADRKSLVCLFAAGPGKGSHAECIAVHRMLRDDLQDGAAAEHWREKCRSVFQWSRYFGGTKVSLQKDVHVNGTASVMAELTVS